MLGANASFNVNSPADMAAFIMQADRVVTF
jgi:hypothetical protein